MKSRLKSGVEMYGTARLIISAFFVALLIITAALDLAFQRSVSDVMIRWCMNFVLALAMVPGIRSGIGLNFGSPLGIVCGLLGGILAIEFGFAGWASLIVAVILSVPFSLVMGWIYGKLLNYVKGSEMMIATYIGFSVVSLFSIFWIFLPVTKQSLTMPMGKGVRANVDLTESFGYLLDKFLLIKFDDFEIPLGYILVCIAIILIVKLFFDSRTGIMMRVAGENPKFAAANGINVDRNRILGTVLSTVLSAVGIIFYSQSYGFLQLYQTPLMMGFQSVAAVLIGGASTKQATIFNAVIGTLLFYGILALSMPVANAVAPQSNLAEIVRIVVSNGIIIYALTKIIRRG